MVFEHIEKLKQSYTDKFVVVDASRPELARFGDATGHVKTVNMNGKALVEFDQYDNIGWFDIDVDFLKVVDRPPPKEPEKKAKPKAKTAAPKQKAAAAGAGGKKLSPLEMARMQGAGGAAKPAATEDKPKAKKMSVADVLAAARGGEKAPADAEKAPPSEAAAKKPSQMSLEEKLAMLRGDKSAGTVAPAAAESEPEPVAEPEPAAKSGDAEEAAPKQPAETSPAAAVDKSSMSVADMVAWCREHDAD